MLLLCLQFAFWMISWGYQTFLKETLSINIFLILILPLGDPAWIFASLKGNNYKSKKSYEEKLS